MPDSLKVHDDKNSIDGINYQSAVSQSRKAGTGSPSLSLEHPLQGIR